MKKTMLFLLTLCMVLVIAGCGPKNSESKDSSNELDNSNEQVVEMEKNDDYSDEMEPNDDGLGDVEFETAGVDDGDGNYNREGETYIDDSEENSIQLGGGTWPVNTPETILEPDFYEAEIISNIGTSKRAVIGYKNVGRTEMSDYAQIYMDNPEWKLISHTNDSDWEIYTGQNGNVILTVEWESSQFSIAWEILE